MNFLRPLLVLLIAVATTIGLASSVSADAPKFHSASASVNGSGALVVNFDERGLGNTNIDYTLTADSTAVYACINGGRQPPAGGEQGNRERVTLPAVGPSSRRTVG